MLGGPETSFCMQLTGPKWRGKQVGNLQTFFLSPLLLSQSPSFILSSASDQRPHHPFLSVPISNWLRRSPTVPFTRSIFSFGLSCQLAQVFSRNPLATPVREADKRFSDLHSPSPPNPMPVSSQVCSRLLAVASPPSLWGRWLRRSGQNILLSSFLWIPQFPLLGHVYP